MPRCRICKDKFIVMYFNQKVCDEPLCRESFAMLVLENNRKLKKSTENKVWKKVKSELKEKNKTHSEHLNELQKRINKIVRLIDFEQPCISCGRFGKPQAGHYHSTSKSSSIRFHLDNIHIQDFYCNVELSSNVIGYNEGLVKIYGENYKSTVENLPAIFKLNKMSIPEVKDKITITNQIIKELESERKKYNVAERVELRNKYNILIGIYLKEFKSEL